MTTVGEYLATRLGQLGAAHVFGVPGDFSLGLVEALAAPGRLEWIGTANELDAGYAADGYARRRGLGAVCTTFGVGELSVINAIAGAYAEHVPVVQITGLPATTQLRAGALLHHSLGDGDLGRTVRLYREVTAAAAVLDAADAADTVDAVLATALDRLRPVYLGVPADVVDAPVPDAARRLERPPRARPGDPDALAAFGAAAAELLAGGGHPVLLVGHLVQRLAAAGRLRALAEAGGWPVAQLLSAKGTLDEGVAPDVGVYAGALLPGAAAEAVAAADPLITVGALFTDVVAGLFTHRADADRSITLDLDAATVAGRRFDGVRLPDALDTLTALAGDVPVAAAPVAGPPASAVIGTEAPAGDHVRQHELWDALRHWLPPHRTLVTDIGTAFWGAAGMPLPRDTAFVAQPVWSSIGYALPATLGAVIAEPDRRAVLVTGDGAAQMTAAELGLLARRAPGTVVVLVDNAGYTIERALRLPDAAHHDVPRWDWPALATALSPDRPPLTLTARTPGELAEALKQAEAETARLTLLRVVTAPTDAPPLLHALADAARRSR
jgi:alpha-keto-acid decarboxylase